jgi:hypothetical protein
MNQDAIAGIGDKPMSGQIIFYPEGFNPADMVTETASFTGNRVNPNAFKYIKSTM